MHLCERFNLTVGIPAVKYNNWIFTEDSKTIKGILGECMQIFISSRKSFPNNCKLINIFKSGDKLKNGSYDGALGAIDKKEIDVFLKVEIPFASNENVYLSYPVHTEEYLIYQIIQKRILDESEFRMQLIRSFSLDFFIYYFSSILFFFLIFLIFLFISLNFIFNDKAINKNLFQIILNFTKLSNKKNSDKFRILNLFLFGLIWFDFLTKQVVINNLKTSKVIVDTSQFITNERQIFKSFLTVAWLEGESDLTFVQNAPKNTLLRNIFLNKNDDPLKILPKVSITQLIPVLKTHFFFMRSSGLRIMINALSSFIEDDSYLNETPFYSVFSSFFFTKGIENDKTKYLFDFSQYSAHSGLVIKMMKSFVSVKFFERPTKNKLYTNIKSYVDEYTKFDSLKYESFHYIFLAYFFLSFLFFLFFFSFNLKHEFNSKKKMKNTQNLLYKNSLLYKKKLFKKSVTVLIRKKKESVFL